MDQMVLVTVLWTGPDQTVVKVRKCLILHFPYTCTYTHTHPVLFLHCPPWIIVRGKNSKSRPPHHQWTSGLLAMVMAQPHKNQRTQCNPSSSMCTCHCGQPTKAILAPSAKCYSLRGLQGLSRGTRLACAK